MNAIDWLKKLISFDTTSRNSNLALIQVIEEWFKKHQISSQLTYDADKNKANLLAILKGNESQEGGLVLSGHTDVVPVDGQKWDSNPFVAEERDGKLFGRGSADMKGFLAVMLALVPELKKLNKPLYFAFSYDEEIGCRGAPLMISAMQQANMTPHACIVGEPTNMRPVIAHKGIQLFRCRIQGKASHSSLTPQGCNAIDYAAQLISYIRKLAKDMQEQGPFDSHFDVPFTTVSTNIINGGAAYNIIPEYCEFSFETRHLPEVSPNDLIKKIKQYIDNELLPSMQKEYDKASVTLKSIGGAPSFNADEKSTVYTLAREFTKESNILKVAYATEAGLFEKAKIPTIICGPGSIEQAHKPNEFVSIEQIKKCEVFLREMIKKMC